MLAILDIKREHELITRAFRLGGYSNPVTKSKVKSWRITDLENRRYSKMPDNALKCFLNGCLCLAELNVINTFHDINLEIDEN